MAINSVLTTATSGLRAASAQLRRSDNLPDLASEIIRLIEAETTYRANAEVIRTAEDIAEQTVNLRA
mgnify:CR=1 FL=1